MLMLKEAFKKLLNLTNELVSEYKTIFTTYQKNKEIIYSKEYIEKNDLCGSLRRKFENNYPVLKEANSFYTDEAIDDRYKLESDYHVGTGITHIRKFYKLQAYIEDFGFESVMVESQERMFYNLKKERVIVQSPKQESAQKSVKSLESYINSKKDFTKELGKISINPIYENIEIQGFTDQIIYTRVYPNGNPSKERNDILAVSGGKEEKVTLLGADGRPLEAEKVTDRLKKDYVKGYVRGIKAKGAKVLLKIKRIANPFKE
ncbi:hypothetical protein M1857_04045 [Lactiplantibacillus plantarum]|nr:hypothetical protein M1857_04045 [Lactiplantibacillus plantarum]